MLVVTDTAVTKQVNEHSVDLWLLIPYRLAISARFMVASISNSYSVSRGGNGTFPTTYAYRVRKLMRYIAKNHSPQHDDDRLDYRLQAIIITASAYNIWAGRHVTGIQVNDHRPARIIILIIGN